MDPLTENQQILAEEAVSRAKRIADRYARIFPEYEQDFESAANYGAVRAASSYTPELRGVWERWSGMCIRGEIKDFLDSSYLKHRRLWIQSSLELHADENDDEDEQHNKRLSLDRLLSMLPEKHREICGLVYRMGMTASDAGVALGYTPNHGAKLHREAIGILRDQLVA